MTPEEKFAAMLLCMVGEDELAAMQVEHEWRKAQDAPRAWGLDSEDEAEARVDYLYPLEE